MVGKWHLGYSSWQVTPRSRGFETFYGIFQGQGDSYTHTLCISFDVAGGLDPAILEILQAIWPDGACGYDLWNGYFSQMRNDNGEYIDDLYIENAIDLLNDIEITHFHFSTKILLPF